MFNSNYNPKYNPHLREQYSIVGCILFDYLQNIFGDKTALPLSKREIATALRFSKAEINLAFKELVKEYKTSTEYKQAQYKFSGKLYCAYTIRGRGLDAQASYIFRNHEPALKSIESVKPDFDFTSSMRTSDESVGEIVETVTQCEFDEIQSPLKSIELVKPDFDFTSSMRRSDQKVGEMAESVEDKESQPLKSIESVKPDFDFTSSMRTSAGKGHPYRDINNIYILSLGQEKVCVEQTNQEVSLPLDTPPTPPPLVRKRNGVKGTEMSSFPADPWMASANNPKSDFANWVWEQNKRKRPEATLPDAKAEIRNNWVRAADLWEEFQDQEAIAHRVAQTSLVAEENDPEPIPEPIPFDKKAGRMALLQKINLTNY